MGIYQDWIKFSEKKNGEPDAKAYWNAYFDRETAMYKRILEKNPAANTVRGYENEFGVDLETMIGFLDGINDSLREKNPLEELTEDLAVNLDFEPELLYKNMVAAHADWLYNLPQWDRYLTEERKKELFREQRNAKTVVKNGKIGRNQPCPCGSGRKYKKCCGQND